MTTSLAKLSKLSKLSLHLLAFCTSSLQVDKEILRGIALSVSLLRGGKLWRKSPLDMSEQDPMVSNEWQKMILWYMFGNQTWHGAGAQEFVEAVTAGGSF